MESRAKLSSKCAADWADRSSRAKECTEHELIVACISGQAGALEELFTRFAPAIAVGAAKALRSARRSVSVTAEDLVQGFALEAVKHRAEILSGFRSAQGAFAPWLTTVVLYHCCKQLRSKKVRWPGRSRKLHLLNVDAVPNCSGTELHAADRVEHLLQLLDEQSREIILARFGLGKLARPMRMGELSEKLGWSRAKLKRRLGRIMAELRVIGQTWLDD